MAAKGLIAAITGIGLSLLTVGLLAWSTSLISAGSGILMVGVISYATIRSEEELRKTRSEIEARFYKELFKILMEEFELYEDRAIYFVPGSNSDFPSLLISHKKIKPPRKVFNRMFFEYDGGLFARLPSITLALEVPMSRVSNIPELESAIFTTLRDLGLANDVKTVERPDGVIIVDITPRRDVEIEEEPYDLTVNLVGSLVAEGLSSTFTLSRIEKTDKRTYRFYFERVA